MSVLDASSHLYKRVCLSVRPLVRFFFIAEIGQKCFENIIEQIEEGAVTSLDSFKARLDSLMLKDE